MRMAIVIGISIGLVGCATGRVNPAGKDTYIVSATRCGFCQPVKGYVTGIAANYCTSIGKNIVVKSYSGNDVQPWAPGTATVIFRCLSPTDHAYTQADQHQ